MNSLPHQVSRRSRVRHDADPLDARLSLETTVARAGTALAAIDDEGCVLAMSSPALDLLGYTLKKAIGQPAAVFVPLFNTTPLARVGYGRQALGVRADGSILHLNVSVIRLSVTDFEGWVLLIREADQGTPPAREH